MKNISCLVFIFFNIISVLLTGCNSSTEIKELKYSTSTFDISTDYSFPQGTYYYYKFNSYNESIDVMKEIKYLQSKNIIVSKVWYRNYRNGCNAPGSDWTTHTMYGSVLLIQLKFDDKKILDNNFSILSRSSKIPCGYGVVYYELKE